MKIVAIFIPGDVAVVVAEINRRGLMMDFVQMVPSKHYMRDSLPPVVEGFEVLVRVSDLHARAMTRPRNDA